MTLKNFKFMSVGSLKSLDFLDLCGIYMPIPSLDTKVRESSYRSKSQKAVNRLWRLANQLKSMNKNTVRGQLRYQNNQL